MSDYKYEMQMIAEELAFDETGQEFYDLSQDDQYEFFIQAEEKWIDRITAKTDADYDRYRDQELNGTN
jgi:hypothetical protein